MNDTPSSPSKAPDEVVQWKEEAAKNLEGWKRASADYQNLKKESDERVAKLQPYITAKIFFDVLPLVDNLRQAVEHIPQELKQLPWAVGLTHVLKQYDDILKVYGIEAIATVGEKFDPEKHESLGHENQIGKADHEVLKELQRGFRMNDMILYPAKVIINIIDEGTTSSDA